MITLVYREKKASTKIGVFTLFWGADFGSEVRFSPSPLVSEIYTFLNSHVRTYIHGAYAIEFRYKKVRWAPKHVFLPNFVVLISNLKSDFTHHL